MHFKLFFLFLLTFSFFSFGQKLDKSFQKESESIKYAPAKKSKKEKRHYYHSGPEDIEYRDGNTNSVDKEGSYEAVSDDQIRSYREKQNKKLRSQKSSLEDPEPIDIPTFAPPDIDAPEVDIDPDKIPDPGEISPNTYRTILFILFVVLLALALYFVFRKFGINQQYFTPVDTEWHPELTPTDDFLIRLRNAEEQQLFRDAVRIQFTLVLKELVRLERIQWKKEKTNASYIYELKADEDRKKMRKCVHYFDLVWYGEYEITQKEYSELKPIFEQFYESLKTQSVE